MKTITKEISYKTGRTHKRDRLDWIRSLCFTYSIKMKHYIDRSFWSDYIEVEFKGHPRAMERMLIVLHRDWGKYY